MKKKLLIILILFLPFMVSAKEIKMEWQKSWGGNGSDEFIEAIPTKENGFIEFGYFCSTDIDDLQNSGDCDSLILKYDEKGNILWKKRLGNDKTIEIKKVQSTLDEGFVIMSNSSNKNNQNQYDIIMTKYDKDGNQMWENIIGANEWNESIDMALLPNGDFIVCIQTSLTNIYGFQSNGESDIIIIKYDKTGKLLWKKNWGGNETDDVNEIIATSDGNFVLNIVTYSTNIEGVINEKYNQAVIIKYDEAGNVLWQKSWGGESFDSFSDIIQTQDKGIVAVGTTYSSNIEGITNLPGEDVVIVKYDKDGNILWQKSWGGGRDELGNKIFETLEGEIIITGATRSSDIEGIPVPSEEDAIIAKYDKDGNLLWNTSYKQLPYSSYITDGIVMSDGTFIATIEVYEYDMGNGCGEDTVLISYDKNGNIIWEKHWGGSHWDVFNDVLLLNNNEIIVSGFTGSTDIDGINNNGFSDALVIKYSIIYDLENVTNENNNGTSTVEQQGRYGIVKPTPNEGYEVDKVIVKDKSGNVLDVEVTKQEDGTYSFELYTDVSVEVLFKEKLVNPKTGVSSFIGVMFTLMLIGISSFFMIRNCNNSYEL